MGRQTWKKITFGCLLLLLCLCAGCSVEPNGSLYALPKQSDAYYNLQSAMDSVMGQGASYCGPRSGSNQQAVQLADLDGDGRDEALAFIKTTGEKPLKVYIFDWDGERFYEAAVIEGEGSAFESVEYAQLDGEPGVEVLVGRQLSDQIQQSLGAYAFRDGQLTELMGCEYSEYVVADLDGDEYRDLVVFRLSSEDRVGAATLFCYSDGMLAPEQEARLSAGVRQIKRIITGFVSQGVPAVFVGSAYDENALVTDIFALNGNTFCNLAMNTDTGISAQTIRSHQVYATDIDEDGVMELPALVVLPSASTEETHWVIQWYTLESQGRNIKCTTYHNFPASWYVCLPDDWTQALTVSRNTRLEGVQSMTFSRWNGYDQAAEEIFTIYAFTGDDRYALAQSEGRFLLEEKGETVYAASLGTDPWAKRLDQETLRERFHFIYLDWNSGET